MHLLRKLTGRLKGQEEEERVEPSTGPCALLPWVAVRDQSLELRWGPPALIAYGQGSVPSSGGPFCLERPGYPFRHFIVGPIQ